MAHIEERNGFEILVEEPPPIKSRWAALVRPVEATAVAAQEDDVKVCLSCTRDDALADARALASLSWPRIRRFNARWFRGKIDNERKDTLRLLDNFNRCSKIGIINLTPLRFFAG